MALIQINYEVFGGMGGLLDNAVPSYADDKAPNGAHCLDSNQLQLMVENGTRLYGLQFDALTEAERPSFFSVDANGKPKFGRVWFIAENGKGYDPFGHPCWLEWGHLRKVSTEPQPQPSGEWVKMDYRFENGNLWLKKAG